MGSNSDEKTISCPNKSLSSFMNSLTNPKLRINANAQRKTDSNKNCQTKSRLLDPKTFRTPTSLPLLDALAVARLTKLMTDKSKMRIEMVAMM